MKFLLALALVLIPNLSFAQILTEEARPRIGRLMEFVADVEIKYDENNLPSHTIEWDSDDPLMEFSTAPVDNLLIVPTGLQPKTFNLKVRIIDWENRRIIVDRVSIDILDVDDIPVPPVDPPTGPEPEWSQLKTMADELIPALEDPLTARALAVQYQGTINRFTPETTLAQAKSLIREARALTFLAFADLRVNWYPVIDKLSNEIGRVNPSTVEDFKAAIEIIIQALEK